MIFLRAALIYNVYYLLYIIHNNKETNIRGNFLFRRYGVQSIVFIVVFYHSLIAAAVAINFELMMVIMTIDNNERCDNRRRERTEQQVHLSMIVSSRGTYIQSIHMQGKKYHLYTTSLRHVIRIMLIYRCGSTLHCSRLHTCASCYLL